MIADYQFGKGIGKKLFPGGTTFQLSRTKRVRQVLFSGNRIATARAKDGFFTLSIEGASVVHSLLPEKGSGLLFQKKLLLSLKKAKQLL
jgi:uncharacterized protein with predicted RNA binding PUA domain